MVLHKLENNPDFMRIVFNGDNSHNICGIFRIWILNTKEVKMRGCFIKTFPDWAILIFVLLGRGEGVG